MWQLQQRLTQAAKQNLLRTLQVGAGIDLSSNDYLGFANDPLLKQHILHELATVPNGSGGSRLLNGQLDYFTQVEYELAQWVQQEAALVFPSGYQANLALLSALLSEGDCVFSDKLNHASLIDGIRLSKAEKIIYPHGDFDFLETRLRQCSAASLKIIVTESLFSMDGTLADLATLQALALRYDAYLVVDEAHSTGIWGPSLVATLPSNDRILATVHCGGKALGVNGAWIAGSELLKNYLINFARPFIFSTAPSPALFVALRQAMQYWQVDGKTRANKVLQRAQWLRSILADKIVSSIQGPIVPIQLGEAALSVACANYLQAAGWNIRAIRPPTVPTGTSRLRLTVKWQNTDQQLQTFVATLNEFFCKQALIEEI